jgi:hypothetical protein
MSKKQYKKFQRLMNIIKIGIIGRKKWLTFKYYKQSEMLLQKLLDDGLILGFSIKEPDNCQVQLNYSQDGTNIIQGFYIPRRNDVIVKKNHFFKSYNLSIIFFFFTGRAFINDLDFLKKKKSSLLFCIIF